MSAWLSVCTTIRFMGCVAVLVAQQNSMLKTCQFSSLSSLSAGGLCCSSGTSKFRSHNSLHQGQIDCTGVLPLPTVGVLLPVVMDVSRPYRTMYSTWFMTLRQVLSEGCGSLYSVLGLHCTACVSHFPRRSHDVSTWVDMVTDDEYPFEHSFRTCERII